MPLDPLTPAFSSTQTPGTATPVTYSQRWWMARLAAATFVGSILFFIAGGLWLNVLDVQQTWVRLFYAALAVWLVVFFFTRSFRAWKLQQSEPRSASSFAWKIGLRCVELCLWGTLWLLALEAVARALPPLKNSSINYPGHRFVWPDRFGPRNALGLNDAEPRTRGHGPRILVLGDSYVEGAGVRRVDRFCSQLERRWQSSHPDCQVIAGGIAGWNTGDEAEFLERNGPTLNPDAVIVGYVLNDAEGTERLIAQPSRWELWLQTRLHSYLCYRLFRLRRGGLTDYWVQVRDRHRADSASWQSVDTALDRIAVWCANRRIPCHLIVLPIFTHDADAVRDVMDQVVTRAARKGFTAYSSLDDFDGEWQRFAVSPHDAHPNAAGHERIARRIMQEMLLPRPEL